MTDKLARVRWEMGQSLLPDHFIAQEEALLTDGILRFRMNGLPAYGIAAMKINESLLTEGIFSISALTLVMGSGLLVQVPGNGVISPFNLNTPGTSIVPVYCHVLKPKPQSLDPDETLDTGQESAIKRIIHQLALSSEQSYTDAIETLKIAQFEKDPDGIWHLAESFIPPLLQFGTSPFFENDITEIMHLLDQFLYKLSQEIAESYLSGDSLTSAKQCLKAAMETQRFLANLAHKIKPHPYYVYETLKRFYTEVCFYGNTVPEFISDPFDNDQLGPCFKNIFKPLKEKMQLAQAPSPYLPFELKDNLWQLTLPARTREAREIYFLIQKEHVNQSVSLKELKIASVSRVSVVHKLSLQGVVLQEIGKPPFQHTFGPEVDFFRVTEGEEWDHALRDLSLGFFHSPQFAGMKYYLYWRFA